MRPFFMAHGPRAPTLTRQVRQSVKNTTLPDAIDSMLAIPLKLFKNTATGYSNSIAAEK